MPEAVASGVVDQTPNDRRTQTRYGLAATLPHRCGVPTGSRRDVHASADGSDFRFHAALDGVDLVLH